MNVYGQEYIGTPCYLLFIFFVNLNLLKKVYLENDFLSLEYCVVFNKTFSYVL